MELIELGPDDGEARYALRYRGVDIVGLIHNLATGAVRVIIWDGDGEVCGEVRTGVPAEPRPGRTCDVCADEPMPGVLTDSNVTGGVQRCDECGIFPGDLDAALALARHRARAYGVACEVRWIGSDDVVRTYRGEMGDVPSGVYIADDTDAWLADPTTPRRPTPYDDCPYTTADECAMATERYVAINHRDPAPCPVHSERS